MSAERPMDAIDQRLQSLEHNAAIVIDNQTTLARVVERLDGVRDDISEIKDAAKSRDRLIVGILAAVAVASMGLQAMVAVIH